MRETQQAHKPWYQTPFEFDMGARVHIDGMQADRVYVISRRKTRHFPPKANAIEWNDYYVWPEFGQEKPFWTAERHLRLAAQTSQKGKERMRYAA